MKLWPLWPLVAALLRSAASAKLRASDTKLSSAPALRLPRAWALLGPWTFSDGEPLDAFGGVQNVARRAPEALWQTLRAGNTSLPDVLRKQLEAFPTEVGPAGQTTWALTFSNGTARTVPVNFTAAAVAAGWNAGDFSPETGHGRGWAMGEMELEQDAKVLAKCSDSFMVGDGGPLLADAYGENRSVHVLHLPRGRHQIYVSAGEPGFWCDFLLDSAAARGIMTNVETDKVSPLIIMKDSVVSEVVASNLVSPHLGIPVLNAEKKGLRLTNVTIVQGANLTVELGQQPIVQPGQVLILRLLLRQQGELVCNGSVLDLALALHTDTGTTLAKLQTTCRTKPWRGFLVAYPDFDGSIQKLWAAPPNVSRFADRRCPARGCPVLLSLHGASVSLGNLWGHSYESHGEGFPYGAWLVQPTNRYHWGTDWEGPGLDNALAALDYVRDQLPGIDGGREDFGLDDQRVLVTGHSMGGHGCFVFATHFPDRLLGAACASGYPSLNSYAGDMHSTLLDGSRRGLLEESRSEHSADFAHGNLRGVPLLVIYGSKDDNVPPTQPRHLARLVQSADGLEDLQLVELPGVGHWFSQAEPSLASWLERRLAAELPEPPRSFEFTVTTPGHYGTKGSWRILQQLDASQPARIVVEANQSWRISSFNVRRLALDPGAPLGAAGAAVLQEVRLDGSVFDTKVLLSGACTHLCRSHRHARWKICGKSSSDCAWRSLQRFASANDVLRAPVCLVAEPSWRRQAVALANKLYFVSRYAPPIVEADAAGCESSNLVLLGGNVKSLSCSFPYIGFTEDSFVLDGNHYLANSTGLLAVGHLRERRLLLLAGEPTALAAVPVTSGRHGADFMLMGSEPWKGEANILAAGYLTPLWGISPSGWSEPDPHSGGFLGGVQTEFAQPKCEEVELSDRELSGDAFRPSLGIFLLAIAFAMA